MQIMILGMHSSGTSCVARLVNMMGAYFGPEGEELEAQPYNPKGFWERKDVMLLNDRILWEAGGRWNQVSKLDFETIEEKKNESLKKEIQAVVLGMDAHRPWFLKDPRMCIVLRQWLPFLEVPVCLFVYRNPVQIAQSLKKRDNIPLFVGLALWEYYMVSSLKAAQGTDLIITKYEDVMKNPVLEVQKIHECLQNAGVTGLRLPSEKEITEFVASDLFHNRDGAGLYSDYLNDTQLNLIDFFEKTSSSSDISTIEISKGSVEILQEYYLNDKQRKELAENKQNLSKAHEKLDSALDSLKKNNDENLKTKKINIQLHQKNEKLNDQLKESTKELSSLRNEISNNKQLLSTIRGSLKYTNQELSKQDEENEKIQKLLKKMTDEHAALQLLMLREFAFGDLRFIIKFAEQNKTIPGLHRFFAAVQSKFEGSKIRTIVQKLEESSLFDRDYYLRNNSDIQTSELDPLTHFVIHGVFEGRKPNVLFDPLYYVAQSPDLIKEGVNPLYHYYQYGWREGRNPSSEFDTNFYLQSYPDVIGTGLNPLAHYLKFGRSEGRSIRYLQETKNTSLRSDEIEPVALLDADPIDNLPVRLIAFYLPQFHAIPENDIWWGKDFTEWTNVIPAKSQFADHYQPHIPGDLGYYDLSKPGVQERQVELAKLYGIGGFCFYFYWFAGKRLLEDPVVNYLKNKDLDLPFCLCWANENWSRCWDGLDNDILIGQEHSPEDDLSFIQYISKYLFDSRYIRVNGKPLLLIYRPSLLPSGKETFLRWRNWCRENGIGEIYLAYTQSFEISDPATYGLDAAIEFPPNNSSPPNITNFIDTLSKDFTGNVYDWNIFVQRSRAYRNPEYKLFRGVNPAWDNTARRESRGTIFLNSSPQGYLEWLYNAAIDTINRFDKYDNLDERLIFVNAWNEWAEGAHLEPDQKYGYAYLEATRVALVRAGLKLKSYILPKRFPCEKNVPLGTAIVVHAFYPDVFSEILEYFLQSSANIKFFVTVPKERESEIRSVLEKSKIQHFVLVVDNRGRDILPFLKIMRQVIKENYDILLKLHTKRSHHRLDGDVWRNDLYKKLILPEKMESHLHLFKGDPDIGMIGPKGHIVPMSTYSGSNEHNVLKIAARMGINSDQVKQQPFIAGSMFYCRTKALHPLLSLAIKDEDFEVEAGQVDGTFAHAIERIFTISLLASGLNLTSTDHSFKKNGSENIVNIDYPFAEKTL